MMLKDKLEFLDKASKFTVKKDDHDDYYTIEQEDGDVAAIIYSDGDVEYFLTGCYNSGSDWVEFDVQKFFDLFRFCCWLCGEEDG